MIFLLFCLCAVLLSAFYIFLFAWFIRGWNKLRPFTKKGASLQQPFFSVLIPARNEEQNILNCLSGLVQQMYPEHAWEAIIIDDHSEDNTAGVVKEFIARHPRYNISLLEMKQIASGSTKAFKKQAIATAIEKATGEWIITTDADCHLGAEWLSTFAAYIEQEVPALVSGPVLYEHGTSFFQRAQALEFSGLIGIGAASIANGSPNLCNGANLAYLKSAYQEVGGFSGIDNIASGDDELLMHKIADNYPGKIGFLYTPAAAVYTAPSKTISEFLQQRRRWVSKSSKYEKKSITAILIAAYMLNLCILLSMIASFFELKYLVVFIILIGSKFIVEWLFLRRMTSFFGQNELMPVFLRAAFANIVYTLFIGIYGNLGHYNWKGRKVK